MSLLSRTDTNVTMLLLLCYGITAATAGLEKTYWALKSLGQATAKKRLVAEGRQGCAQVHAQGCSCCPTMQCGGNMFACCYRSRIRRWWGQAACHRRAHALVAWNTDAS